MHGPSGTRQVVVTAHKCPGQKVSYAESMIDISGREFGIKLGHLIGIRI